MTWSPLTFWNLHRIPLLLLILSTGFYAAFAHDLERSDTVRLLTLLAALFFLCYKLIQFEKWNYRFLVAAGILFRLVFLWAEPNLSPDYFRFLWDGNLLAQGFNPYLFTPDQWMEGAGPAFPLAGELHGGMEGLSARNFSNYPPVNQYFFALARTLGGGSLAGGIIALRATTILADLGILYFGRRLLRYLNKAPHLIFWYFLNPMVIVELTGNLHFEGVMLFFFILAMYLLVQGHWFWGAIPFALSIGVKLMPLMLLPLMLPLLGWKRAAGFYLTLGACLAACLYPLYFPEFGAHYLQTLRLWFSNFEFNAGLYALAERVAVWQGAKPWLFIAAYGRFIPWVTAAASLLLCLHPKMRQGRHWFSGALAVVAVYYLASAVVHPWYLAFPLLVCLFTRWRFPLVWSALAMLSYTAYSGTEVVEKPMWLIIEYLAVYGFLLYEIIRYKGNIFSLPKNSGPETAG